MKNNHPGKIGSDLEFQIVAITIRHINGKQDLADYLETLGAIMPPSAHQQLLRQGHTEILEGDRGGKYTVMSKWIVTTAQTQSPIIAPNNPVLK